MPYNVYFRQILCKNCSALDVWSVVAYFQDILNLSKHFFVLERMQILHPKLQSTRSPISCKSSGVYCLAIMYQQKIDTIWKSQMSYNASRNSEPELKVPTIQIMTKNINMAFCEMFWPTNPARKSKEPEGNGSAPNQRMFEKNRPKLETRFVQFIVKTWIRIKELPGARAVFSGLGKIYIKQAILYVWVLKLRPDVLKILYLGAWYMRLACIWLLFNVICYSHHVALNVCLAHI